MDAIKKLYVKKVNQISEKIVKEYTLKFRIQYDWSTVYWSSHTDKAGILLNEIITTTAYFAGDTGEICWTRCWLFDYVFMGCGDLGYKDENNKLQFIENAEQLFDFIQERNKNGRG